LGKAAPERLNQSGFSEARDDEVAVTSVGPYARHLHLTSVRQPRQHLITQFFYRLDVLPNAEPTASHH